MSNDSEKSVALETNGGDQREFIERVGHVFLLTSGGIVLSAGFIFLLYDYSLEIATRILQTPGSKAVETELIALFLVVSIHCLPIAFAVQKLVDYLGNRLDQADLSGARVVCVLAIPFHAITVVVLAVVGDFTEVLIVNLGLGIYTLLGVGVVGLLAIGTLVLSSNLNLDHNTDRILRASLIFLFVIVALSSYSPIGLVYGTFIAAYAAFLIDSQIEHVRHRVSVPVLVLAAHSLIATLGMSVVAIYRLVRLAVIVLWAIVRFTFRFIPS